MTDTRPLSPTLRSILVALGVAIAYAAVGTLVMNLALAPAYASPLYPSAGIGLAAVLVYRWPGVVGTALGAFAANYFLDRGATLAQTLGVPLAVAAGASMQALAGAALTRRFVRQPLTLGEPRDIAAFYALGAFVACTVSASISTAALGLSGAVAPEALPRAALTWWLGDSLGTLIGAPIALTLIGRPRDEWAPRRMTVGLTLTLVTVLLATTITTVANRDRERTRNAFERDASSASAALTHQLDEPLRALEALYSVVVASDDVSAQELRLAARGWLDGRARLQAVGLSQRLRRADVPAFEAAMRAQGHAGLRVFDRGPAGPSILGDDLLVIRAIEPAASNTAALGVNALSIPASRAAMEAAIRTDRPAATAGFALTQAAPGSAQTGVVVYRAIYRDMAAGVPATEGGRIAAAAGVVFVTLRLDDILRDVAGQIPADLGICLLDTDPRAAQRRLAGAPDCEAYPGPLQHVRPMPYAGRQWEVRVFSRNEHAHAGDAWLFAVIGLAAVSVLGALLLTVTGRTRRIEAAVRERTSALQQQVREREQAEAALRMSEQRFRSVFNNVPIGVVYTDLRGNIKEANPFFCQMTGYSLDELTRMSSRELTHPDDWAEGVVQSRRLVDGEVSMYRRHKRYVTRSGQTMWAQNTFTLMPREDGRPARLVAVVEDITEHLRLAEAEHAREAAELSNRAKSEFLSRMSHELRTPLNAMLGFAQLLDLDQRHGLADAQRVWVGQIQQAGWHLLEMINDVLDLSRIEAGTMRLSVEALSLPGLLDATLALVEGDAAQRGIVISRDLQPDADRVLGDSTRVKQILTNLLSNAVKYNTEQGRIHVTGRQLGDRIEVAVTDTGLGMSPQQLKELFQPFNRLGRERSQVEGTGIGLVISQRLAELMGGSLVARSHEGEGSSFILTLPAAVDPDTVRSELDGMSEAQPAYHRRVVHYVEDNETNVEVMRGVLAQRPQVALKVSITGLDGLAAIRAGRPDVVLLDMHLPDIDGLELLRHLRADPATSGIPVVVVSADALSDQIDEALAAGAVHYLTKPVSVSEVLRVVDQLLERSETRFG